eukprot:TRINITY_DN12563_c0_g3_i3.p1 TRINITY_DN12563_c0_g3~~TRINITY_DN12563_c0_g3_i3.p1  ORF type:complete len:293 (+),score=68.23 TRINITY_DN12563_c0_g3_i3:122-880(+)
MLASALDEVSLDRVLHFINEPVARLCCKDWAHYIYQSLELEHKIAFNQALSKKGCLSYHHSTVRDLGGMEECVSYSFTFERNPEEQTYVMQWFREGLTADNEQQYGKWSITGATVTCETLKPPKEPDENLLRYASPGRIFQVPVSCILLGATCADATPEAWELDARGLLPDRSIGLGMLSAGSEQSTRASATGSWTSQPPLQQEIPADARFVEIDGDLHQVSQDIVQNWPESDWQRLMRCRLRFGTGTERWP